MNSLVNFNEIVISDNYLKFKEDLKQEIFSNIEVRSEIVNVKFDEEYQMTKGNL